MINIDFQQYEIIINVKEEKDIILARQSIKHFCQKLGFSLSDITKISTSISELARNIFRYAKTGSILAKKLIDENNNEFLEIVAIDNGPGISDIDKATTSGFTTTETSLGLGLSGVKRLMDYFYIDSEKDKGTIVIIQKRRRKF
ncbi:serine/threonine-protein kinase RsbT [Hypnocyclicus thermotrophus]|uniref:Serine/threonine-protein kinase RsbT n=1 Tax=Hypnocyclicus thermotrophus TaxID=1627895 RepID=A0AA46E0Q4_9FUSO|nr:ATP-binding protein [Hypnocyclicus thermotrophus]TDT72348.1 serine/threonine-protein kinase RsbT [Hypnocyclicus thermotrophus]